MEFVYSFGWVPRWAATNPSTCAPSAITTIDRCSSAPNLQDWDDFVTAIARRYKGRIAIYELWNEAEYSSINAEYMAVLSRRAVEIIRAADSSAKVVSISLNGRYPDYADKYFGHGGPTNIDVISLHGYASLSANFPEGMDKNYRGRGALLSPLIPVLKKYGLIQKPLWDTESSWSDRDPKALDSASKAAFVSRALLLRWASGIRRFYWYAWDHSWIGRLENTAAGGAYVETRKWMQNAIMDIECSENSQSAGIWVCGLRRGAGYRALVVWSTKQQNLFDVPLGFVQYRDVSGTVRRLSEPTVKIGPLPILLETSDPPNKNE
jgi:hypothetical protein